jgi:hypothetical protein
VLLTSCRFRAHYVYVHRPTPRMSGMARNGKITRNDHAMDLPEITMKKENGNAGIAQSVERLATGCMVRRSIFDGGKLFRTRPDRPWGPTQPPVQWVPGLFSWGKPSDRGVDHPRPSRAKVKEREELYLYSISGPSWPVRSRSVTFTRRQD